MKLSFVMKTPDALKRAIRDELISNNPLMSNQELNDEASVISDQCSRWFRNGENVTLVIDTDENTCVVAQNKK